MTDRILAVLEKVPDCRTAVMAIKQVLEKGGCIRPEHLETLMTCSIEEWFKELPPDDAKLKALKVYELVGCLD